MAKVPFIIMQKLLQLSPNAGQETIERVYRLLTQRYHPDNRDSGDAAMFRQLLEAYRSRGDPEKRAAYDVDHQALKRFAMADLRSTQVRARDRSREAEAARRSQLALCQALQSAGSTGANCVGD